MSDKYDLIFSLGSTPITSELLKEIELQVFDFPFDTISGSDFFTKLCMLLNDCSNFIEQKNITIQKDTPKKGITEFKDLKTGFIYNYDFDPEKPVENLFPLVKLRYDRYIKNLKLCMNAAKRILIVYIENPIIKEDEEGNTDLILEASEKLKIKYPNKEFKILYIKNDNNTENIKITQIGKYSEKINFNFYRKFSDASSCYIDISMLSMALTEISLKKSMKIKKIFFLNRLLKLMQNFKNKMH